MNNEATASLASGAIADPVADAARRSGKAAPGRLAAVAGAGSHANTGSSAVASADASAACRHLPVIVHSEHDSALDALLALNLPRDDVMDLVVAAWARPAGAILATVDGGRPVAAVPLADGRWAAGNAYPEQASASVREAGQRLARLLRRGRHGLLVCIDAA